MIQTLTARHRILANGTVQQERYHHRRFTWFTLGDVVAVSDYPGSPIVSIHYRTKAGKPRTTSTTRELYLGTLARV